MEIEFGIVRLKPMLQAFLLKPPAELLNMFNKITADDKKKHLNTLAVVQLGEMLFFL